MCLVEPEAIKGTKGRYIHTLEKRDLFLESETNNALVMQALLDRLFDECSFELACYSEDLRELLRDAMVVMKPACHRVEELRAKWGLPLENVVLKMAKAAHCLVVEEDPRQAVMYCEQARSELEPYAVEFRLTDILSDLEDFYCLCVTSETAFVVWPR